MKDDTEARVGNTQICEECGAKLLRVPNGKTAMPCWYCGVCNPILAKHLLYEEPAPVPDFINPTHYKRRATESIEYREHMNVCVGDAFKYLYRLGAKDAVFQELGKALWYIDREVEGSSTKLTAPALQPLLMSIEPIEDSLAQAECAKAMNHLVVYACIGEIEHLLAAQVIISTLIRSIA